MIRSRTLRPGQVVRVGYTELVLGCAPGGLAATSSAPWTESDFVWLGRAAVASVASMAGLLKSLLRRLLTRLMRFALEHWLLSAALIAFLLYLFAPQFRDWVGQGLQYLRDVLKS